MRSIKFVSMHPKKVTSNLDKVATLTLTNVLAAEA